MKVRRVVCWRLLGVVCAVAVLASCGKDQEDDRAPAAGVEETGIALTVDILGGTDVAGVEFRVGHCQGEEVARATRELEDLVLPGMIPGFEEEPFDARSQHLFADYFLTVEPGCYDVHIQPVRADGGVSQDCMPQNASDLQVVQGYTTEVVLVANCGEVPVAGLDVVAALNHPPEIKEIIYSPSKFAYECEQVEICVTAYDPNGDPMEFVVEKVGGPNLWSGPQVVSVEQTGKWATGCIGLVPVYNGTYDLQITVYDQGYVGGELVRMETLGGSPSRSRLVVPVHTNWDIELHCYEPEEDLYYPFAGVRTIDRLPGCIPIWPHQYFCSQFWWEDTDTTCPGGEFLPETVYPACGNFPVEEPIPAPWLQ